MFSFLFYFIQLRHDPSTGVCSYWFFVLFLSLYFFTLSFLPTLPPGFFLHHRSFASGIFCAIPLVFSIFRPPYRKRRKQKLTPPQSCNFRLELNEHAQEADKGCTKHLNGNCSFKSAHSLIAWKATCTAGFSHHRAQTSGYATFTSVKRCGITPCPRQPCSWACAAVLKKNSLLRC